MNAFDAVPLRQRAQKIVVAGGAKPHDELAGPHVARIGHLRDRHEELRRVALGRIHDAAVQQRDRAGDERLRADSRGKAREALFVESVFEHADAIRGSRIAPPVFARRAGRRERAETRVGDGVRLDFLEALPRRGIGRIALLRHRIAEIRDPRQPRSAGKRVSDHVRGRDRVRRPERPPARAAG